MEQNPETIQYQQGGYAPYVDNKPGEPMLQPPLDNNYQTTGNYNQLEMKNGGGIQEEDLIINYMVRRGFIIKTYGILISQLALTTIFICLSFIKAINDFIKDSDFIRSTFFIAFCSIFVVVTITVIVVFMCCRDTARKFPINYILLFSFTLCMSFYLLIFCSFFETSDVIVALILTVAVTVGLTIYAIRTKTDFTYCGGFLFAFSFLIVFTVAFYFWIRVTVFWIMIGIFIYSLYIIYDTQLIIGKVGCEYNIDDYCLAALNLYIDISYYIITLFDKF